MGRKERNEDAERVVKIHGYAKELVRWSMPVLLRAVTDDTDIRVSPKTDSSDPEWGASRLAYSDRTGELAISKVEVDGVLRDIRNLSNCLEEAESLLLRAVNIVKSVRGIVPQTVEERAQRSNPDCLACGEPTPQPRGGFDEQCYKRWAREGRPDRAMFIAKVKRELAEKAITPSQRENVS